MCALVASASADVLSPDEAAAVEWVRTMVRDSGGKRVRSFCVHHIFGGGAQGRGVGVVLVLTEEGLNAAFLGGSTVG